MSSALVEFTQLHAAPIFETVPDREIPRCENAVQPRGLQRRYKSPLAKVGVEGSNPFARSKSPSAKGGGSARVCRPYRGGAEGALEVAGRRSK